MKKVYILTEEFEGTDGVREFQILGASEDAEKLKVIMNDLVEKDEYELFAMNGIFDKTKLSVLTDFTDHGYIGYFITEEKLI